MLASGDLVSLSLIQNLAEQSNPEVLSQLIAKFTPETLAGTISVDEEEPTAQDETKLVYVDEDEPSDPGTAEEFAAAFRSISSRREEQE